MADILIVNKHGKFHTAPESILAIVEKQGGRVATDEERKAYRGGAAGVDAADAPISQPQPPAVEAPFADYDELNVDQVVARLKNMTPEQLVKAFLYEAANKHRKTVLDAIGELDESQDNDQPPA